MIEAYLRIGKAINKVLHISREQIESKCRTANICDARNMLASLLKYEFPNSTLINIAEIIGKRNHATIVNMYKNHNNRIETDECYRCQYERILDIIHPERVQKYDILNMYAIYRPNGELIKETLQPDERSSWLYTNGIIEQGFKCEKVEVRITKK